METNREQELTSLRQRLEQAEQRAAAAEADTARLDWLGSQFIKDAELSLRRAPAGNLSIGLVIQLGRAPMSVRAVIDAARGAKGGRDE